MRCKRIDQLYSDYKKEMKHRLSKENVDGQIIYKYRDWSNNYDRQWLTAPSIYLASPGQFLDCWDCNNRPSLICLQGTQEKTEFLSNIEEIFKNHQDLDRILYNYQTWLDNLPYFQRRFSELFRIMQYNYYGVCSFSLRGDIPKLWNDYATGHKGFCIAYDREKLEESFPVGKLGDSRGGVVIYKDEFPKIHPNDLIDPNITVLTKFKLGIIESNYKIPKYEYEKEYRIVKEFQQINPKRVIPINYGAIKRVILGSKISKEYETKIRNICNRRDIEIVKSNLG